MVVELVSKKYLPINFFDDESTQEFFHHLNLNVNLPQKNALRSMISSTFKEMHANIIKTLLNNSSKISFTVEIWTSVTATCFYGITSW